MSIVTPAVLPTSRKDLEQKLALLASLATISRVQIDTVDGRFATPASWPYSAKHEVRDMIAHGEMLPNLDRIEYEIDLMCLDVERAVSDWFALGASRFTIHAETALDLSRLIASLREHYGCCGAGSVPIVSFGLALNIASDLALVERSLDGIDYVQFMGIAIIGRQGLPFDRRVFEKIRLFRERHPEIAVQVDGGVSLENARELLALGVSSLVAGSAILYAKDPAVALASFEALQSSFGV